MLYFLKHVETDKVFYLTQKDVFYVGRKDCDFLIQDDQSISRKHASLKIQDGKVILKDLGSKYQTTCDGCVLKPEVEMVLELRMQIKFGVYHSVYSLEKEEVVTTGTHLNAADKKKLKNVLNIISGSYVDNWGPDCTHLTVKEMSVTVKVLHALLDEKPIVVSDYWTQFSENVLRNLPPPDIEKFNTPPVGEPVLKNVNFKKKVSRKCLFKNKLFIFPLEKNKQLLEETINKAAGECKSWEKNKTSLADLFSSSKDILVMQVPNQEESSSYAELSQEVVKRGMRPIPLHEIALAVITGSCAKDCNPNFDRAGAVFTKVIPILPTQTGVLAESTQSECLTFGVGVNETAKIVPDTFDPSLEHVSSVKKEKHSIKMSSSSSSETLTRGMDQATTSKRKNDELMGNGKRMRISVERVPLSIPSRKNEPQQMETVSGKESSASSKLQITERGSKAGEVENSQNTSQPTERKNPFTAFLRKRPELRDTCPEKSSKRFKTENTNTSLEAPSRNNVFTDLSRGNNSNSILPTEMSFANDSNILSSTRQNAVPNRINITRPSSREYFSSIPWISKSTTVKEQPPEDNLDPELRHFADLFKGKVVIEFIQPTKSFRNQKHNEEIIINESNSSKKNFKKFKKVLPKKPQRIILRSNESVQANSTGIPNNQTRSFSESDDEESPNRPNNIRNKFLR